VITFKIYRENEDGELEKIGTARVNVDELEPLDEEHKLNLAIKGVDGGELNVVVRFVEEDLVEEELPFIKTKFFKSLTTGIEDHIERDYIIILDKSGSMSGSKWEEAKRALSRLAPFVCKADPDGITLYVFSHSFKKYNNISDTKKIDKIFNKTTPGGSTALHSVLKAAFKEHFHGDKPTTILVITDGVPDDKGKVIEEIEAASNKIEKEEDLSVTFIQIGDDSGAAEYLKKLDDDLEGNFDIVDTLGADEMQGLSFEEMIYRSIYD